MVSLVMAHMRLLALFNRSKQVLFPCWKWVAEQRSRGEELTPSNDDVTDFFGHIPPQPSSLLLFIHTLLPPAFYPPSSLLLSIHPPPSCFLSTLVPPAFYPPSVLLPSFFSAPLSHSFFSHVNSQSSPLLLRPSSVLIRLHCVHTLSLFLCTFSVTFLHLWLLGKTMSD